MTRRHAAVLAVSAALQLALAALPDTMGDLLQYRTWARQLASSGLAGAYWPTPAAEGGAPGFVAPVDYPPLFPYVLLAIARALGAVAPESLASDDRLLDFLIRLPLVACSLLLALLVYSETRRHAPRCAGLALAAVALNPAIVFDTAYWGQADAPCALLVTASLVALGRGRPTAAWLALAAAALVKPFAYPFAPLVLAWTLRRHGAIAALHAAGAALAFVAVAFLPFAWTGHATEAAAALFSQVDAMPYTSVNAHNLWWLAGAGVPWTEAHARVLGPVTWNGLALALFGALYLVVLRWLARAGEPRGLYLAAATIAFGFFVLSTHMHENHLFYALPPLALAAAESKALRLFFVVLTAALLANMALHDPFLTHWARPHTPGPELLLPPVHGPLGALQEQFTRLGYPWIASQLRGETTLVGHLATLLNAELVVIAWLAWLALVWQAGGLDPALRAAWLRVPRRAALLVAALAVAAFGRFLAHALAEGREERGSARLSAERAGFEERG